jgi:hypothetical protein
MKTKKRVSEQRRINMKIDSRLVEWAFAHAKRRGVTLTHLVETYFTYLRRQEEALMKEDAEQV